MDEKASLLDKIIGGTVRLSAFTSGIALLWLMGLTVVAVIMRYLFNAPILGAHDISRVSLVLVVYPAMAYCGWTGGHVALDLISYVLKGRALRWADSIIQASCAILFVYITWQTIWRGLDAFKHGEASNLIEIPHAPFFFVIAIGSGLYALVLFIDGVKAARGGLGAKEQ